VSNKKFGIRITLTHSLVRHCSCSWRSLRGRYSPHA